jgi:hypothetical protein
MLIDAALRGENLKLARALLSERTQLRPRNIWGWKHAAKATGARGEAAAAAQEQARRLLAV